MPSFKINGCDVASDAPNRKLLSFLREDLGLMGTKDGCSEGACGACTVLVDGKATLLRDDYCDGLGDCLPACPVNAITMNKDVAGELMLYKSDAVFSTAELKMGSGTSGMLVSEVKKGLRDNLVTDGIVIIDGSPGIGCPVIASITGVDFVLIVSEPSISGISDMKRIIETANHFKTKVAVCINKYDTNIKKAEEIEEYCIQQNIPFVGSIPFDNKAVKAINEGKSIIDEDTVSGKAVKNVYLKTINYL